MSEPSRRLALCLNLVILAGSIALAVKLVSWVDREFLQTEPAIQTLEHPYRRLQHDLIWVYVAATLGVAGMLAVDRETWSRRGLARPGTIVVAVIVLVGGGSILHQLFVGRVSVFPVFRSSYDLYNVLEMRVPGAILGAWVVAWLGRKRRRHRPGWRERLARAVGWLWISNLILLIGYGLLFG